MWLLTQFGQTRVIGTLKCKPLLTHKQVYININNTNTFSGNSRSGFGSARNQGGFGGSRGGFQGGNNHSSDDMLEVEIASRDIARVIGIIWVVTKLYADHTHIL